VVDEEQGIYREEVMLMLGDEDEEEEADS